MAWTQADVDALKAALKNGTKSVSYADRTIVYHSLAEMLELLTAMQADLSSDASTSPGRSTFAAPRRD